jgi:hypothetical protein
VRRQIPRGSRTKQDDRGLLLGHLRSHCLPYRPEPKTLQELALSIGESYLVGLQAEIRWHLIAIAIGQQDESVEKAMQHRSNNA